MDADRWASLQTLLLAALDLPPDQRAAFLDAHADIGLAADLKALLDAADDVPAFLDAPPAWSFGDAASDGAGDEADLAGRRIGPYRIVRELGRGGQGRVFLAERDDIGSRVALKLVRGSLAAPDLVRRLLTERRVLAGLDHPHIARLLDAGTVDAGLDGAPTPYFVMEVVDGEPLTAYAAAHALPVPERLRLFVQACEAVAFAHRRLVIHRDLKPSNLLVADGPDGRPAVKLLDFGIAKLLADDADPAETQTGQRMLTPAYAAPEQLLGAPVTVATDVYALGVLLYELLADVPPYDASGGLRDVLRAVCDVVPPPPSARAPDPARRRLLRGDLDGIVGTALAKAPDARYDSADVLRDDLLRHLDGRPVRARAPTARYRASRFLRRHAAGVAAAAVGVLLLVGAGLREGTLRRDAEAARDDAQATTELLLDLFGASAEGDGTEIRPDTLRAQALVDRAARRLDARTDLGARRQALLTLQLGHVYNGLGLQASSTAQFRDAVQRLRAAGDAPDLLADALFHLGMAYSALGRCTDGHRVLDESIAFRRALGADEAVMVDAVAVRAAALVCLGRYDEAVADFRAVERVAPDSAGFRLHSFADALERAGRPDEAIAAMRASVDLAEALYPAGHAVETARRVWLAALYERHGRLAESEREARRAHEAAARRLGRTHATTLGAQYQLSRALRAQGRPDEGVAAALVRAAAALPPRDEGTRARAHHEHAQVLLALGRLADAEVAAREALSMPRALLGSYPKDRVAMSRTLRDILLRAGRPAEAAAAERDAVAYEREIAARSAGTPARSGTPARRGAGA